MRSCLLTALCLVSVYAGCTTRVPELTEAQRAELRTGPFGMIHASPGGVIFGLGQDSVFYTLDSVDGRRRGDLPQDAGGDHYLQAGTHVLRIALVADSARGFIRVPLQVEAGHTYEVRHKIVSESGRTVHFWLVDVRGDIAVSRRALLNFGRTIEVLYRPDDDQPGPSS